MSETVSRPEDRYVARKRDDGWFVQDQALMCTASAYGLTWCAAHELTQRMNREYQDELARAVDILAAISSPPPAAPCCGCRERLDRIEQFLAAAVPVLARNVHADDHELLLRALGEMQAMKGEGHAA